MHINGPTFVSKRWLLFSDQLALVFVTKVVFFLFLNHFLWSTFSVKYWPFE